MSKLTPERLAEIRENLAKKDVFIEHATPAAIVNIFCGYADSLLAELDRITPQWVPVSEGTYLLGRTYEVACTSPTSPTPVWMGRAKYVEQVNAWLDSNTGLPFAKGIEVTHFYKALTPAEMIGQPTL